MHEDTKCLYHSGMSERFREAMAEHGAMARLARACEVTHPAVQQWVSRGIPAERVLQVERLTGISRHELRPDVFGHDAPLAVRPRQESKPAA